MRTRCFALFLLDFLEDVFGIYSLESHKFFPLKKFIVHIECIGFYGLDCLYPCGVGVYGAQCKEKCNCSENETCNQYVGCTFSNGKAQMVRYNW